MAEAECAGCRLAGLRECDVCGLTWASEAHFMLAIREAHQALPTTHPSLLDDLEAGSYPA